MIRFVALVVGALLFKLLGGQYFTPLSFAVAGFAFFLRYFVGADQRRQLDLFLLQFGILIYALSNQDPSYYEHIALAFCLAPALGSPQRLRRMGGLVVGEGTALLLFAYIVWSLAWTASVDMSLAGIVMSALCLVFLLAFVVTVEGDLGTVYRHVLQVLTAVLVASLLAGIMGYGNVLRTFAGVTLHRNQLGFLLGLLILLSLFCMRPALRWRPLRWLPLLGAVSGAALLLYADSKSTLIAIAVTALLWFIATAKRWKLYAALAALAAVLFVVTLPSPRMDHFAMRMGRDPTFTSRTEIWADSVKLIEEQPFTGFGYNAVWSAFENRLGQYHNAPGPKYAHAHNAWLDWTLQLGIGGLLVYVLFLGTLLARAIKCARTAGGFSAGDFATGVQAACLLVYVQIYDLANVSTVPITRFGFFMLAAASACLWLRSEAGRMPDVAAPVPSPRIPLTRARRFGIGVALALAAFLGAATFAVWDDGRRFAAANEQSPPAPDGVAAASYLEAGRFQWKSADQLHGYAHARREELLKMMNQSVNGGANGSAAP